MNSFQPDQCDEENGAEATPSIRIDNAHTRGSGERGRGSEGPIEATQIVSPEELPLEEVSADVLAYIAGRDPVGVQEQLDEQAVQLASHLAKRLKEVDRREAALNARIAQLETELRYGRLADRERILATLEREKGLELRERAICDLEADLARRQERVLAGEATQFARVGEDRELEAREDQLRQRRQEVDRQVASLHHAQVLWSTEQAKTAALMAEKLATSERKLEEEYGLRHRRLDEVEVQLLAQTEQLAIGLRALSEDRQGWMLERERQVRSIEKRAAVAADQIERKSKELAAREQVLDQQQVSLATLQGQLHEMHREALEMRLIAEQLWAQTSGRLSTPEVMQSIAALRLKLAEHYQIDLKDLATQREQLGNLATKLAEQAQELDTRHQELKTWRSREQEAVHHEARQLLAQQIELEDQSQRLASERAAWQEDRRRLLSEIRSLRQELQPAA